MPSSVSSDSKPVLDRPLRADRHDDRRFDARIVVLYGYTGRMLAATAVNGTIVAALLLDPAPNVAVVGWWAGLMVLLVARALLAHRFRRRPEGSPTRSWARRFTIASTSTGAVWGLGAVILCPPGHTPSELLLAFVLGGMSAGSAATASAHLPAFYGYATTALVPMIALHASYLEEFHLGMALMLVLTLIMAVSIARTSHATLESSLALRFSNESLVAQLTEARASLERRVALRTRQLEEESRARSAAEAELHQARRVEALGRLTGGVAHDFHNLLTIIVSSLEMLALRSSDEVEHQLVRPALDAALRGGELTRNLLAFSHRPDLRPRVVDLRELIQRLFDTVVARLFPASMSVQLEIGSEPQLVEVDPGQLETALLNLFLNARDATRSDGTMRIELEPCRLDRARGHLPAGRYVEVRIIDDGAGISPEILEHVFEPFFTTKGRQGTGLGLSLVYGFATQSGGSIDLESHPGSGTTARLLLPGSSAGAARPEGRRAERVPRGDGELVLAVEDDPAVRALALRSLESLGYRAIGASHGAEALELLDARSDIALLMTDVVMPGGLDGLELAALTRQRYPRVRVLVVSGYHDRTEVDEVAVGLKKPYRRHELAHALRQTFASPASSRAPSRSTTLARN